MAYNTINIAQRTRPCLVTILHRNAPPEERKALFYGLYQWSEVPPPNPKKDRPEGQQMDVRAMVEFEDGNLHSVAPGLVRLLDSPREFKEYAWGDEEPEETTPEGRRCLNCRHYDLDAQDEPCWSCGGPAYGYKDWEAKE